MQGVLLALVAEPPGRLALPLGEIARRAALKLDSVRRALDRLAKARLVRPVDNPPPAQQPAQGQTTRYELMHDSLVDLVLPVTRDLQDRRRQANRVLSRALEDCTANPRHTIGLRDRRLVKNFADEEKVQQ